MADRLYTGFSASLEAPAQYAVAVTPDDDNDLAHVSRALYIGGAGDVSLVTAAGDTATFTGLPAGFVLPVRTSRVRETGTTATGIIALA